MFVPLLCRSGERVFRPWVLLVTATHIFAHFLINIAPKIGQVRSYSQRPLCWREQVCDHRNLTTSHLGCFQPAKQRLELSGQHWAIFGGVVEPDTLPSGNRQCGGSQLVELLLLLIVQQAV